MECQTSESKPQKLIIQHNTASESVTDLYIKCVCCWMIPLFSWLDPVNMILLNHFTLNVIKNKQKRTTQKLNAVLLE